MCEVERLRAAYLATKRDAAAGIDGETWQHYGENLEANLQDLSARLARGAYQAKPVRRAYIPKTDGRLRPLGVPTLGDKIVQRAVAEVCSAIYETDFLGFSYGFRPGRSPHQALDALTVGITRTKVNWVLDADIRDFFGTLAHEWLVKFVEHRIGDRRVVRLIQKWLSAGVLEDGKRVRSEVGTVQGGSISPVLANIYLHYVLDLWAQRWRKKQARGDVVIVRFCDDFVVGFEHREEAERFLTELRERLAKFGLGLHSEKTRLIEFGRFADKSRRARGDGKPESFNFLGFTHICGKTRQGTFTVLRQTMRKRWQAKLQAVRTELKRRLHLSIPVVGAYLRAVITGHNRYYGVPMNGPALEAFRLAIARTWLWALRHRSQRSRMPWTRFAELVKRWLPQPLICHPYPGQRLAAFTQGRSRMRNAACPDLWRGSWVTAIPTPTSEEIAVISSDSFRSRRSQDRHNRGFWHSHGRRKAGWRLPLALQFLAAWLAVWLGQVLQEQVDYLMPENRPGRSFVAIGSVVCSISIIGGRALRGGPNSGTGRARGRRLELGLDVALECPQVV